MPDNFSEETAQLLRRFDAESPNESALLRRLQKPCRIKFGIDPTGAQLHLGHAVPLRFLEKLRQMGHTIILLLGGFTAMVGDPTGKNAARPPLSAAQVQANGAAFLQMASKVLATDKVELRNNAEWHAGRSAGDFISFLARGSTVNQLSARRDFRDRLQKEGGQLRVHELVYPLLQGEDSVQLRADVELGGTDQLFNLLEGRAAQKTAGQPEQEVLMLPLLEGTDGTEKMSKTANNFIGIADEPQEMFGKIMSIPDELVEKYFRLLTDVPTEEIQKTNEHPREKKMRLALEITTMLHSAEAAQKAQKHFVQVFSEGKAPTDMPILEAKKNETMLEVVRRAASVSGAEARRLLAANGVSIDGAPIAAEDSAPKQGGVLRIGKRRFFQLLPPQA